MNKRPLVPYFLQKLDEKLLRNKPTAWAARMHLVVWFAALFALALTAFCYLAFFDAKQYFGIGAWVTFVGLIAFIGFVFWVIFLLRFNVFKRYGNWFAWDGLKTFGLYFVSIGAIVAVCFIPSAVQTFRANQQFGNEEVVNDINEININACKLEYNLLPLKWRGDSCKVVDRYAPTLQSNIVEDTVAIATGKTVAAASVYRLIDTTELRKLLNQSDSTVRINDSMYAFFTCPDYTFVSSYDADEHTTKRILSDVDIYKAIIKNYQKPDRRILLNRMDSLKTKYGAEDRYSSYYREGATDYYENDTYDTKIKKKYNLGWINNGINNVVDKKYAWVNDWEVYLRIFYYTTLLLTLLVFIFRHSTVKTFFLTLLAAVILMIFTGLVMVMSRGNDTSIFSFMIIYYVVFTALALSIFTAKVRNAIQGIGLNLFLFMTPFIPVIFVALNKAIERERYYNSPYNERQELIDNTAKYIFIAEIAGSVILLILLEPLFRKLYRKWFAAAEH